MRKIMALFALAALVVAGAAPARAGQEASKPDNAKVLGTWAIEAYADGMSIYLTLVVRESEGKLAAKLSEQYGMFTDAPAEEVSFDGTTLKTVFMVPSPPDGLIRSWAVEGKIGEDVLEGAASNAELMISVSVMGKRTER
jgi:hypothetical protein